MNSPLVLHLQPEPDRARFDLLYSYMTFVPSWIGLKPATFKGYLLNPDYRLAELCAPRRPGRSKVQKVSGPSPNSPSPIGFVSSHVQNRSGSGCFGQKTARARSVSTEKCHVRIPPESCFACAVDLRHFDKV
jgi:hypothetical protein